MLGGRRPLASGAPAIDDEVEADREPIPRRTRFEPDRTSGFGSKWWRPRSTFGRVLLGTAVVLVLGGAVTLGVIAQRFLAHDGHFRIGGASSIDSTGLSEVNRTEILPVFGEDIGRNIFFVPLRQRRQQLEAIPWVQQATVMRLLPDRLNISIVERTPVAFVRQGSQIQLADANGVILSMPPSMMAQHHYSFPVVTGIDAQAPLDARQTRMAVYQRFVSELDRSGQHLTEQVSEIDLSDPEDLRAVMPEQGADILAHFGQDQFLQRLEIYKAHIAEWRGRYPKLIGVDLRYNGEVPLEMSTAGPGSSAATAATATIPPADVATAPATGAPKSDTNKVASSAGNSATLSTKARPGKASAKLTAAQKAAEARKKALKLKASKAKAAQQHTSATAPVKEKTAAAHPAKPSASHAATAVQPGR